MLSPPPTIGGIRVSTDLQADRYGPDRQREDIIREAERAGLTVTDWVEEAISGTDTGRAAENRYYQLARQYPGLNVIFSHPNRVGRHVEVTVGIARTIHQLGGTVWIAGLGNLRDRRNWRNFLRDAAEAENDHSDIVERLQRGKYSKAARNLWPHGQPPYGYRIVRDERGKSTTLEPHPETSGVVRRIFREALAGAGSGRIALGLLADGIASPRPKAGSGRWTHKHVLYILANEAYSGRREFRGPNGEIAVVTFPALISGAEWRQARELVRTRAQHRPARTARPALWAGHARCAVCGGGVAVQVSRDRSGQARYLYYRCRNMYAGNQHVLLRGGKPCTMPRMLRVEEIDEAGWDLFTRAMQDRAFLGAAVTRDQPARPDYSARLAELREQMAETVRRVVTHGLPDEVLEAALAPLRAEVAQLERDSRPVPQAPTPDMTALAQAMAAYLPTLTTQEERREALDTWHARLYLGPEGVEKVEVTVLHAGNLL